MDYEAVRTSQKEYKTFLVLKIGDTDQNVLIFPSNLCSPQLHVKQ
jgi:hypothetical protein